VKFAKATKWYYNKSRRGTSNKMRKIILATRSEKFAGEAFDCIAQSSSAIKVSSRCPVNAIFFLNHVTTGGQKWQEDHSPHLCSALGVDI